MSRLKQEEAMRSVVDGLSVSYSERQLLTDCACRFARLCKRCWRERRHYSLGTWPAALRSAASLLISFRRVLSFVTLSNRVRQSITHAYLCTSEKIAVRNKHVHVHMLQWFRHLALLAIWRSIGGYFVWGQDLALKSTRKVRFWLYNFKILNRRLCKSIFFRVHNFYLCTFSFFPVVYRLSWARRYAISDTFKRRPRCWWKLSKDLPTDIRSL